MNKIRLLAFLFILTPILSFSQKTIKIEQCNAVNDATTEGGYSIIGNDSIYFYEKKKYLLMQDCRTEDAKSAQSDKEENSVAEFLIGDDIFILRARKTDNNNMSLFVTDNDSTTAENELSELEWSRDRMIFLRIKSFSDEFGGVICPIKENNTYECAVLIFNRQKKFVAKVPFYRDIFDFQFFSMFDNRFFITSDGVLLQQFIRYSMPNNKLYTQEISSGKKDSIEIKHPDYKVSDYRMIVNNANQLQLFTVCYSKSVKQLCKGFLVKTYLNGQKKFSDGIFSPISADVAARYTTNPKSVGLPYWNDGASLFYVLNNGGFMVVNLSGPPSASFMGSTVKMKNDLRIMIFDSTMQLTQTKVVFRNASYYVVKDANNMGTRVYDGYIEIAENWKDSNIVILFNSNTEPGMENIRTDYAKKSTNELKNYILIIGKNNTCELYKVENSSQDDFFVREAEIHTDQKNTLILNIIYSNSPGGNREYFGRAEVRRN